MDEPIRSKKRPADWHKADIKAALEKAGWTLRKLSVYHGYSPGLLKEALRRPYPNAERLIAKAIGARPEAIWPSRYDQETRPLRGVGGAPTHKSGPHVKHTSHAQSRNGHESKAA